LQLTGQLTIMKVQNIKLLILFFFLMFASSNALYAQDSDGDGILDVDEQTNCTTTPVQVSSDGFLVIEDSNGIVFPNPLFNIDDNDLVAFTSLFNGDGEYLIVNLGRIVPSGTTIEVNLSDDSANQCNSNNPNCGFDAEISEVPAGNYIAGGGGNQLQFDEDDLSFNNLTTLDYVLLQATQFIQIELVTTGSLGGGFDVTEIDYLYTEDVITCNDDIDSDGDGIFDRLDLDSDNDGILDADEALVSIARGCTGVNVFTTDPFANQITANNGASVLQTINLSPQGYRIGDQITIDNVQARGDITPSGGQPNEFFTLTINGGTTSPQFTDPDGPNTCADQLSEVSPNNFSQTVSVIDIGSGVPGLEILVVTGNNVGRLCDGNSFALRYTVDISCVSRPDVLEDRNSDSDGIADRLDLDSDGDGCSDANEYYANANADGNSQGGDDDEFGSSPVSVDTQGRVSGAGYNGTGIADARDNTVTGGCTFVQINTGNWDIADRWRENLVPTSINNARINTGVSSTIIQDQGINNLEVDTGSTLTINPGASLTVEAILDNGGNITLDPTAALTVEANLNNAGNLTLEPNATSIVEANLVNSGNSTIKAGASLTVNSNLTNVGNLNLRSVSDSYSSLIVDGTATGNVTYNRFVNPFSNDGTNNDNDLITPPVSGQLWSTFLSSGTNANDLLDDGNTGPTTYAFAPFNKSTATYNNFNSSTTATLENGVGYRVATDAPGTTLAFTGAVETGQVDILLENFGPAFKPWNLIGNPYPSYLDLDEFLNHVTISGTSNIGLLFPGSGIYGYDGDVSDGWLVISLANVGSIPRMAPGQGFYAAVLGPETLEFTPAMRVTGNDDDFIPMSDPEPLTYLKLQLANAQKVYKTEFYFNSNSSLGLDHGYDAQAWGGVTSAFMLYSHLVSGNTGVPIALQSLNSNDLLNVSIPLGVNASAGEEITFSIAEYALPENTEVYLEDTVAQTSTLLNTSDYSLTPASNLSGTGRFFLNVSNQTLSAEENTLEDIIVYAPQFQNEIMIKGILNEGSTAEIYDALGRRIIQTGLSSAVSLQSIDVSGLSSGMYIVKLQNGKQIKTHKVIIK